MEGSGPVSTESEETE